MRKVELSRTEREWYACRVANYLAAGGKLQVIITGTSASNLSYRYKVNLWFVNELGKIDNWQLNYWLAAELGQNLTNRDELRGNGVGFDRAHDAAYTIGRILHRYGPELIGTALENVDENAPAYVGVF